MSTIKVDTVQSRGGGAVTLTNQSAAKMFIDIPSDIASINNSLNVSSLDDDGTGDGGINLTTSLSSGNYAIVSASEDNGSSTPIREHDVTNGTQTSSGYDFEAFFVNSTSNRTNQDCRTYSAILGDLA